MGSRSSGPPERASKHCTRRSRRKRGGEPSQLLVRLGGSNQHRIAYGGRPGAAYMRGGAISTAYAGGAEARQRRLSGTACKSSTTSDCRLRRMVCFSVSPCDRAQASEWLGRNTQGVKWECTLVRTRCRKQIAAGRKSLGSRQREAAKGTDDAPLNPKSTTLDPRRRFAEFAAMLTT